MDRVLVIDDDVELCALVREYLEGESLEVEFAHDGSTGLARAQASEAAIVILDIMLPKLNGLDVLRQLRAVSNIPVLLLTAKGTDVDRIVGLELGADDYLPKPFNPRELVARIRAILRRTAVTPGGNESKLVVGDVELDPARREVTRAGIRIELTAVEFNILAALLQSVGKVVKRDELSRLALGRVLSPFDRSIDVHVSKIRKKLGAGGECDRIKTLRSVGYLYALPEECGLIR